MRRDRREKKPRPPTAAAYSFFCGCCCCCVRPDVAQVERLHASQKKTRWPGSLPSLAISVTKFVGPAQ